MILRNILKAKIKIKLKIHNLNTKNSKKSSIGNNSSNKDKMKPEYITCRTFRKLAITVKNTMGTFMESKRPPNKCSIPFQLKTNISSKVLIARLADCTF